MDPTTRFILTIMIGFGAQIIDGALGMGFGVISSSLLLIMGVPPALASSSVHLSKVLTNGASALSHWRFGNVDRTLLRALLPAGIVGGVLGALVISALPHGVARPLVGVYLFITGLVILWRALRHQPGESRPVRVGLLGLGAAGGFLDAIGGGGWGPVVTSTLLARGTNPRLAIGSGNTAEFFVAAAIFVTFSSRLSVAEQGQTILGLIIGGVLAAPLAAFLTGRIPTRATLVAVGLLVIVLSVGVL